MRVHRQFSLCILGLASCGERNEEAGEPTAYKLTFSRDIAPIIFENCSDCHHVGGPAPFALLDWADVRKRATDVLAATQDRYMPPWLPEAGDVEFSGKRHLSDAQIEMLRTWVDQGALEGDPSELPKRPEYPDGWQLGKPDHIVNLDAEFTLQADGRDVFRNFVFPVSGMGNRYVRAVEIRPGNLRAVHHAWMTVDTTGSCRELDAIDSMTGFSGMSMGYSQSPDGQFVGWTPGKMPHPGFEGMAWRLTDGMDLVLQLHLLPSGKPEPIRPSIGLYFSDKPPSENPFVLLLKVADIDVPAGEKNYLTEQSFTLPVDAKLLSLYPHAHYVCRDMEAIATLPGGRQLTLLKISDWDFNWQDQYYLEDSLTLPQGTVISMKYIYDNSAENPRNPKSPPQRVVWGDRSSDEMGSLAVQLLPNSPLGHALLQEAAFKHDTEIFGNYRDYYNYGNALQKRGEHAQAITQYRKATAQNPRSEILHHNLAGSLAALGQLDAAIESMHEAIRLNPEYVDAQVHLGNFLVMKKEYIKALECYRRALEIDPGHMQAQQNFDVLADQIEQK